MTVYAPGRSIGVPFSKADSFNPIYVEYKDTRITECALAYLTQVSLFAVSFGIDIDCNRRIVIGRMAIIKFVSFVITMSDIYIIRECRKRGEGNLKADWR